MIEKETSEDADRSLYQDYTHCSLALEHNNLAECGRGGSAGKAEGRGDLNGGGAQKLCRYGEAWTSEHQIHLIDHVAVKGHAVYGERSKEIRADDETANAGAGTWSIKSGQKAAAITQAEIPADHEKGS
jgi:hypothetical protein